MTLAASPGPWWHRRGSASRWKKPGASHSPWQPLGHPRYSRHARRLRRHPVAVLRLWALSSDQKIMNPIYPSYYAPTMSEPDLTIEPCDICGGPVEIVTVGHHAMGDMTETTESREPEIKYQCTVDKSHQLAPRI